MRYCEMEFWVSLAFAILALALLLAGAVFLTGKMKSDWLRETRGHLSWRGQDQFKQQAIEHGAARYSETAGEWAWIDRGEEP